MSRSPQPHYHIGLRTIKTGLAVVLALLLDSLRPNPLPIFAAIGAIVVMSRTRLGSYFTHSHLSAPSNRLCSPAYLYRICLGLSV